MMLLMEPNALLMPLDDVYEMLIHFVRREDGRMEESVRKAFYNLLHRVTAVMIARGGTCDCPTKPWQGVET